MSTPPEATRKPAEDVRLLVAGTHGDPHSVLGVHPQGRVTTVRAFHPDALEILVAHPGGIVPMRKLDPAGLFEAEVATADLPGYRLRHRTADHEWEVDDPYRFMPTLGELDLHLIGEGQHQRLWERLGARVISATECPPSRPTTSGRGTTPTGSCQRWVIGPCPSLARASTSVYGNAL